MARQSIAPSIQLVHEICCVKFDSSHNLIAYVIWDNDRRGTWEYVDSILDFDLLLFDNLNFHCLWNGCQSLFRSKEYLNLHVLQHAPPSSHH